MIEYRCKCGNKVGWASMPFQDCEGCSECHTTMAFHPEGHKSLQEHDYQIMYNQTTSKPYKRCKKCFAVDEESYIASQIT